MARPQICRALTGLGLVASLVLASPVWAQAVRPTGQDGAAQTALTQDAFRYLKLETLLEERLSQHQLGPLEAMLSRDFMSRNPSSSLDRSQWLTAQNRRSRPPRVIRDIEVQRLGEYAVVSFVRYNPSSQRQQYVIDIWQESGGVLQSRYESPPCACDRPAQPAGPVRPDGKG